jgi:hypothetical protein
LGPTGSAGSTGATGAAGATGPRGPGTDQDAQLNTTGNPVFQTVRAAGDITAFYNSSDANLKENIKPIDFALQKVLQLTGYTFNYIGKPEPELVGVIAQELERVLPQAVYEIEHENGIKYKAVRYELITALLIQAIKDLKEEVDKLK